MPALMKSATADTEYPTALRRRCNSPSTPVSCLDYEGGAGTPEWCVKTGRQLLIALLERRPKADLPSVTPSSAIRAFQIHAIRQNGSAHPWYDHTFP